MILKDIWLDVKAVKGERSGGQECAGGAALISGSSCADLAQGCPLVL